MTLEFHALATLFPLLNGEDFDELVADIRANFLAARCAWCRKAERSSAMVVPFGAGNITHGFTPNAGPLGINRDGQKPPRR
jgi:hypothetical protein